MLLLDAGSTLMGSDISLNTAGFSVAEPMAAMGYDAMTIGVMDAVKGIDALRKIEADTGLTLVSANVADITTGELLFSPYTLVERQGKTIAVLGLSEEDVRLAPGMSEAVQILDPITQAKRFVPELLDKADVVVVLSHLGVELDHRLATEVPDINVIIGGNSRSIPVQPELVGSTAIARVEAYGAYLGKLTVQFSAENAITDVGAEAINLVSTVPNDEAIKQLVQKWLALYPTPTPDPALTPAATR